MAKYVPLIRVLAPNAVLLSLCYGATEGAFGVAADLVEYACLCPLPPSLATPADQALSSAGSSSSGGGGTAGAAQAPDAAEQPGVGCDRSERAGSPCSVLPEAPGIAGFKAYSGEEPGQAPYILCPNYGVYYEFLPLDACSACDEEQPEVLRWVLAAKPCGTVAAVSALPCHGPSASCSPEPRCQHSKQYDHACAIPVARPALPLSVVLLC